MEGFLPAFSSFLVAVLTLSYRNSCRNIEKAIRNNQQINPIALIKEKEREKFGLMSKLSSTCYNSENTFQETKQRLQEL